jgi:hypothetical protein
MRLDGDDVSRGDVLRVLELAYEHRRFEIEMYWKRATYFWALQAAILAAIGFSATEGADGQPSFDLSLISVLSVLGALTALAGYLTAVGSKFWQESWETHVDILEAEFDVPLAQVVVTRGNTKFSVSKLNQNILSLFGFAWFAAFVGSTWPQLVGMLGDWGPPLLFVSAILAGLVLVLASRTKLTGSSFAFGESTWVDFPRRVRSWQDQIILRDIPGRRKR